MNMIASTRLTRGWLEPKPWRKGWSRAARRAMLWVLLGGRLVAVPSSATGATAVLTPVADTFLSEFDPDNNIGALTNVAAGTVSNGTRTRALIRFDIAAALPAGVKVTRASLRLQATRVSLSGGANSTFDLRRVLVPWVEGSKGGLLGKPAGAGETTWNRRAAPDTPWTTPGGALGTDFTATASASTAVAALGAYVFGSSPELVADVQSWLEHPESNFGWVLMTRSETTSETSRRFASREDPDRAPQLNIDYDLATPQFQVTGLLVRSGEAVLSWTNGRPSYQVQTRTALDQPWTNVGAPTNGNSTKVPVGNQQAFFQVVSDYTARYQVVFDATWSALTHPAQFPGGSAHWSGLVGGVHDARVHFWREGEPASEGIRMMAELGSQPRLLAEVGAAVAQGTADFALSGGGINPSPGSRALLFAQPVRRDYPLVSLCSMVAPSPDWFVGVDSLSLLENQAWVAQKTVALYAYDAGTDDGATFLAPDQAAVPRGVVTRITGFPALVGGVLVPFGTFTFSRLE